jgi:hypothetical protein
MKPEEKFEYVAQNLAKESVFNLTLQDIHAELFAVFYKESVEMLEQKSPDAIDAIYKQFKTIEQQTQ